VFYYFESSFTESSPGTQISMAISIPHSNTVACTEMAMVAVEAAWRY